MYFHVFNTLTNTRGDSLKGYQVRLLVTSTQAVAPIFGDAGGTPIFATSGITDVAVTDAAGVYNFFVESGTYDIQFLTPTGVFVRSIVSVPMLEGLAGPSGPQGDPGGNVMSVGAFSDLRLGLTTIPTGTGLVQTSSYAPSSFRGGAQYVYDPAVNTAFLTANPRTSFLSADGRGFRLDPDQIPCATAFGATVGDGVFAVRENNTQAVQAALYWVADYGASLQLPKGLIYCLPGNSVYPFRFGQNGTSTVLGGGYLDCGLFWDTNDTHTNWCIRMPEDYLTWDNKRVHTGGDLAADNTTVAPTGRNMNWSGFTVSSGYGKYAQGLFVYNVGNSSFDAMCFDSAYRGCYASGFNITFNNPRLSGTFSSRPAVNYLADMDNAFGLFFTNHTTVNNASAVGCGMAIWANGGGGGVYSARLEVNAIGVKLGGSNLNFDTWNGTVFTGGSLPFGGTMEDVTTESNFVNWDCVSTSGAHVKNCGSTGFVGGVAGPGGRNYGRTGIIVRSGVGSDTVFDNFADGAVGYDDGYIMQGSPTISGGGSPRLVGENTPFSRPSDPVSVQRYVSNTRLDAGLSPRRRLTSFDSQMAMRGLTELDVQNANVFANNLGGTRSCTTGNTAEVVSFLSAIGGGETAFSSFPTTATDGASTIVAGTFAYASTVVGFSGETGISWDVGKPYVADNNFRSVTVAAGQRVNMSFYGFTDAARIKHRVYKFDTVNNRFMGYWEFPGTDGTFADTGQAFTGQGVPPPQGSSIMGRAETDTAYQVLVVPSWSTTAYVAQGDKTVNGFTVHFGTAAPSGASFDWMLLRGKS